MKKEFSNKWISLYFGYCNIAFQISPASYFDERAMIHIALMFFKVFIHLPIKSGIDECEFPEYGFYTYKEGGIVMESFWWCWNMKKYCFRMPWSLTWVRTSNLRNDSTWEHETKGNRKSFYEEKWKDLIWNETYPYTYTLNNGTIQNRTANIKVEEREWRWKLFTWLPFPRYISKTISVDFNDEVGERTGSWKGGTTGCGYKILKNETPLYCLRRMEKERKF